MAVTDRLELARRAYRAYETNDRELIEGLMADDLVFYSPPDPGIHREQYFERCWPNAGHIKAFDFKRMVESGDEVLVTYECTRTDGRRFRNTEILTFERERITRVEVYFGWDLD